MFVFIIELQVCTSATTGRPDTVTQNIRLWMEDFFVCSGFHDHNTGTSLSCLFPFLHAKASGLGNQNSSYVFYL